MIKNLSISKKIIILATALAMIFLGVSFGISLFMVHKTVVDFKLSEQELSIKKEQDELQTLSKSVDSTVLSISRTPPFQGIIRSQKNDEFDELDNSTYEQWRKRLSTILISEIESNGIYDKFRFLDENGKEIVRVNNIDGKGVRVEDEFLQNNSHREFFLKPKDLSLGEIYLSRVELNKEGAPPEISIPYKPVIRYATPIFDEATGEFKGVFVANLLFDVMIDYVGINELDSPDDLFIIDQDGFFLSNSDDSKEWGDNSNLGTGVIFDNEFNEVSLSDFSGESGSVVAGDNVFSYATVNPNLDTLGQKWILIDRIKKSTLLGGIDKIVINGILIAIVTFIILFFIFMFFINKLTSPIKDLANVAKEVAKGNFDIRVKVKSNDEIGKLSEIFNNMIVQIGSSYASLEKKVKEKTQEIEDVLNKTKNKNIDLENTKKAMMNVLEDVEEEKKKVEFALIETKKFKQAVDNATDQIVITDPEGIVIYGNKAVEDTTGYTPEEAVGKKAAALWKVPQPKKYYEKMWKTIKEDKKPFVDVLKNRHKSGKIYDASVTIFPILDSKNEIIFFVSIERDVTKEKEIDRAKSEFVSLASHQLRTPLSSIKWYAEMLINGDAGKINDVQKEYLDEIYSGNERMVDLVNSLLNVSRLELGTFSVEAKPLNPVKILEEEIKVLHHQINLKKQKLQTDFDNISEITADNKMLRIIYQNLLSNAVKYTPEEGEISISLKTKGKTDMEFKVKDSGYGIPKEQQSKIFTKLFRADNVRQLDTDGTGLGLYILKSIVEHIGGKISFKSEEGKGTEFTVVFPKIMKNKKGSKSLS